MLKNKKLKMITKNYIISFLLVFLVAFVFFLRKQIKNNQSSSQSKTYIRVMTYPSFVSPYGPGAQIKKRFESICQCEVRWMKVEDSTLMSQRLQIREDGLGVDLVLGLDQITLISAYQDWRWKKIPLPMKSHFINNMKEWKKDWAIPISWSPLTWIVKKGKNFKNQEKDLPQSFQDLLNPKYKKSITLPHPRTSTLGLQFFYWIYKIFGFKQMGYFLKNLRPQIYTISDSWSSSYGLFQKGFAQLSFSYQTSLVYHRVEEKKNSEYFSASFKEGHPYQVEYVAIPQTCRECQLAQKLIQFLLSKDVQKILMKKNYMLPVVQNITLETEFNKLQKLKLISYKDILPFLSKKKQVLQQWDQIFYRL